ncbi:helix-turn-helix domain-containing protein [Hespellia stercorisuis]|uniref:Transcriptional regulator, XRE family with cupin sensor n=1 Tax=Hespellia stercorisuis DSM 15480 TaxID=1121950 RepID=A0A1M6K810_9FIRM|nr:XRE family transcriptional regulator [Hespellia stercorisuis]SHJ55099.1 transcriptional regulator, XRE family with cupin sensor [Hespellia stercorisuis DSM 15480]
MEEKNIGYLSHNIAVNLKRIRKAKEMSLDVVSEQTGVSKSMLAQIEKENANPSIGVLGKIASGLRIEFSKLLEPPKMDTCMVRAEDTLPTKEVKNQYTVWTCFPFEDNRVAEITRIDIEPQAAYVSGSHGERTMEYISVLEGEVTIEVSGIDYAVTKADVFRFESDQEHIYKNKTDQKISFLVFLVDGR